MKNMMIFAIALGSFINMGHATEETEEAACPRCEKIREYNASHPENNYYWYEDYLTEKDKEQENLESPASPTKTRKP